jgi:hypothetical protein
LKKKLEEPKMIECYFIPSNNTSSATICGNCGKEKFLHTIGSGIKVSKSVIITQEEPKDVVLGYKTSLDAQMLDSQYVDFSNPNADKITSASTTSIKEEAKQRAKNYMRLKNGYVEPKQETLEEAAENYVRNEPDALLKLICKYSFKDGAKWQDKRMYSEEDLISFAHFYFAEEFNSTMQTSKSTKDIFTEWLKQFKNK